MESPDPQSDAPAHAVAGEGADAPAHRNGSPAAEPQDATAAEPERSAGSDEAGPVEPKRRRRRRRGRKREPESASAAAPVSADVAGPSTAAPETLPETNATLANLAAGLFSHLDDREVPCRSEGCRNTWTWTAAEQMQAYGQPPPRRMCASCRETEAKLHDLEVRCLVDACKRTWTWTRDAQAKQRARGLRQSPAAPERPGKRRRNRGKPKEDGPPRRMCELCKTKFERLIEREVTCKVHGCTRNAVIDRDSQLRGWAALRTEDLEAEAPMVKRMCDVCREFCRTHPDREVPCGRPGCVHTWMYKTGAQLQAWLAGRLEDPIRLCDTCLEGGLSSEAPVGLDHGAEIMPCIVPGCEGTWRYTPGMQIAAAEDGDQPLDRMCTSCRTQRSPEVRDSAS